MKQCGWCGKQKEETKFYSRRKKNWPNSLLQGMYVKSGSNKTKKIKNRID